MNGAAFRPRCGAQDFGKFSFAGLVASSGGLDPSALNETLTPWLASLVARYDRFEAGDLNAFWKGCGGTAATFPLRLLAIVNRLDLHALAPNSCGEVRFVFGGYTKSSLADLFVIVENTIHCDKVVGLQKWALAWKKLGAKPTLENVLK